MEKQFTVDYFINKFSAIPEDEWIIGKTNNGNKMCALGFCQAREIGGVVRLDDYPEALSLYRMFNKALGVPVFEINDGRDGRYRQPHPKQRILAALYDIKKMTKEPEVQECDATMMPIEQEAGKTKKEYVVVKVSETIYEQAKELILS